MPNQPDVSHILMLSYLKKLVGAFFLSFIIAKLTKWSLFKAMLITIISKMVADALIAPILISIPMAMFFPQSRSLIGTYANAILITPFIHLAVLQTISTIFLSKKDEYDFGAKAYLVLVLFKVGTIAFALALFKLAPKYFLTYFYALH